MQAVRIVLVAVLLIAAGCSGANRASSDTVAAPETSATPTTTVATASTAAPVAVSPATTEAAPATLPTETTAPAAPTTTEASPECTRVTGFATDAEQQSWRVTLDGVMGGRSSGEVAFGESTMIFTGEIVTEGGGFSLLRTPLDFDALADGSFLTVRARTDGRRYEMVFKDSLAGRPGQLFHEADVPFVDTADWQEVPVQLSDLRPTSNGRPVQVDDFDKDAATEMGVILKDGVDGAFRIEVDWVDICS